MKILQGFIAALSVCVSVAQGTAQTSPYPDKPIRMLVGFAPAGPADITARVVGEKLAEALGKPVVVENVAGAGGNVATERAVKVAADGYTLYMAASSGVITNPILYGNAGFDPGRDLAPISQVSFTPNILAVNNDLPVKTVQDLVALARAQPGKLNFGSAGVGTSQHLAGELFKSMAKLDIQHVPYRGIAQVMPDLLGGRLTMAFGNISGVLPLARDGKVRALAVTSPKRWASTTELRTMDEQGFPGFDATAWFGLMAPTGTPAPILARLHAETVRILAMPDVRKRFDDLGMAVIGNTPAEFATAIRSEIPHWTKVIKDSGAKITE